MTTHPGSADALRKATRQAFEAMYRERDQWNVPSFHLSETGAAYKSPWLEAEYRLFVAGYRAALSADAALSQQGVVDTSGPEWTTVTADRALYVDFGKCVVACDRLPSPVTLILKNMSPAAPQAQVTLDFDTWFASLSRADQKRYFQPSFYMRIAWNAALASHSAVREGES